MNLFIYDICTKQNITIESKNITQISSEMGVDYTSWYKLTKSKHVGHRYILNDNRNNLFVLVDFDTQQEYECISNKSIFIHLKCPYDINQAKYVNALRCGRQTIATICGRAFHIKGQTKQRRTPNLKAASAEYKKQLETAFLRRKISSRLRCRIRKIVASKHINKTKSSNNLLGCSIDFFLGYLRAKFIDGMSWDNYGEWHVDHKVPLASATEEQDLIKLCHYTNLQPLWAKDNLSKGDKIV